ncbi:TOMM precursor leader peptide-binding protein [Kamptonema cortianum]|nr:TOMM precursor leader peptide-binding protein [Kamptonema cortianum]
MMFRKPRFKTQFQIEVVEDEGVFLLSERGAVVLSDRIYQDLCPLLDGTRTTDEVVEQLQERLSAPYVYYALMELEKQGYLMESETPLSANLSLFSEILKVDPQVANARLQSTSVSVKALGNASASGLIEVLQSLQIQVAEDGDFEMIVTDDYLRAELSEINLKNQRRSRPWMLVKPLGTSLWIGPIFQTPETGCWQCLAQRLQGNRPIAQFIQKRQSAIASPMPPLMELPSTQQTAFAIAATEVLKWIIQKSPQALQGVLLEYHPFTLETRKHPLIKRPQCPCCGILKPEHRQPLPLILGSRPKKFITDGGHRGVSPEETLERYQYHISPITGIVRELGKLSGNTNGLTPTYFAKHHFASVFDEFRLLQQNIGGRSAGKGRTETQAKASAFCEAIERYSGVFQGDELRIQSSYQQLGEQAIHPNHCLNFSEQQYATCLEWNAQCQSVFQRVPAPFDETRDIEWTPVWSLTHQTFKYLPTAYCYFGYPQPSPADCWADTNGCAAGNTLEEAILQGFMELVERDSVALWWYNRISRPGVDLASFAEPYFQDLIEYYRSIHRQLWVLDITSDLQIPTFAAISRRCDREIEDIILGFGSHFDPKLAIQRALTEVNQLLPPVLYANADGSTQYATSADPPVIHWWKTATVANQPYLTPSAQLPVQRACDYPYTPTSDLLEDLKRCQQIVEQKGMEMLVLDQTRPDIGLRVVKVIIPGMRHFWKRLAPGRLYEVPVQLGWLEKAIAEEMLNPVPLWL